MDPDWDELRLPKRFERRAKAWRRNQGGKTANRYWKDLCRITDDRIRFEDLPSNAPRQCRPMLTPSPEAKPSNEQFRGSLTEGGASDSGSMTTSESGGELTRKRKRKHEANPTETIQDDSGTRAVAITRRLTCKIPRALALLLTEQELGRPLLGQHRQMQRVILKTTPFNLRRQWYLRRLRRLTKPPNQGRRGTNHHVE